ncbi:RNA-directed DNA polymerase, eukaryota, reverse transcriptase zinc-binding domain protein [Tanacetum coccineum]
MKMAQRNDVDLSKVLVRGSGSYGSIDGVLGEIVPVANSFQALDDQVMEDKEKAIEAAMDNEYINVIWPKLKQDVVSIMESGVYPSLDVRKDWSLRQMDFFYQNCHKCWLWPKIRELCVSVMQILFPMINLFSWNTKGLNNSTNQNQVIDLLHEGNYSICALLETKVKKKNLNRVCSNVLGNWHWISNNDVCVNRTGIVVGWDPQSVRVMVLSDFNVILDPSERSAGSSSITSSMIDFRKCLAKIEVEDLVRSGLWFTWNKSPSRTTDGLLKKLDRVLSNFGFVEKFSNVNAQFLPFVVFDHSPSVLVIPNGVSANQKNKEIGNAKAATEKKKLPEKVPDNKDAKLSVILLKNQIRLIRKASKHPSGDSLLVEEINVVEGALCFKSDHTIVEPLIVSEGAKIGECVTFVGYEGKPKDVLNLKKKQLDKITPVKGSILTPYKVGGPFLPLVEPEATSLPLVGVGLSTSQPPPYTVEDGSGTHNPWKIVLGVTYLL